MTEDEFIQRFNEVGSDVADLFYPKNDTAANGDAPSPGRGEFLRDLGVLCIGLLARLKLDGFITASNETDTTNSEAKTDNDQSR